MTKDSRGFGEALLPLLFFSAAFLWPLTAVILRAAGSPSALKSIVMSPYYRGIMGFTLRQAALSTLFSVLLGIPGAWLLARRSFPGREILKSLTTVPFVLPPILAVLGFVLLFGNSGFINTLINRWTHGEGNTLKILYSLKAIVLAHVFYNFPLTVRLLGDTWAAIPENQYKSARSLGAGPFRAFFSVDVPRLLPAILRAAILTFLFCFLSFAVVLVLGGGPSTSTLEVEVYRLIKHQLDFSRGSALALLESSAAFLILAAYLILERRLRPGVKDEVRRPRVREPKKLSGISVLPALIYLLPALLLIVGPLVAIIVNGFLYRPTWGASIVPSLHHWVSIFGGRVNASVPVLALVRTLALAAVVALNTTFIASLAARYTSLRQGQGGRILGGLLTMPLGVGTVILGFGYLLTTRHMARNAFAGLTALAAVHTVAALPFAYRIISSRFKEISPRILQAALSSGAGPIRVFFTIEIPMARRALVTTAVLSLAISAGELNATMILAPGSFTTLPLAIYRAVGAYDFHGASVLGTMLIVLCTASFLLLDRFGEEL